ncbi:MAG: caspase family protein [Natronohydrobacter sp.]|nr:caspase family protein [Natronohydrobacter sp.]
MIRILTLLAVLLLALPAFAQSRHAPVVGIGAYDNFAPLEKACNDARAVGERRESAGFQSYLMLDSDGMALLQAPKRSASCVQPSDGAVFFFAGHVVELDGEKILLPADIPAPRRAW